MLFIEASFRGVGFETQLGVSRRKLSYLKRKADIRRPRSDAFLKAEAHKLEALRRHRTSRRVLCKAKTRTVPLANISHKYPHQILY